MRDSTNGRRYEFNHRTYPTRLDSTPIALLINEVESVEETSKQGN